MLVGSSGWTCFFLVFLCVPCKLSGCTTCCYSAIIDYWTFLNRFRIIHTRFAMHLRLDYFHTTARQTEACGLSLMSFLQWVTLQHTQSALLWLLGKEDGIKMRMRIEQTFIIVVKSTFRVFHLKSRGERYKMKCSQSYISYIKSTLSFISVYIKHVVWFSVICFGGHHIHDAVWGSFSLCVTS